MNDELQKVLQELPEQLEEYNNIKNLASGGEYDKALEKLKASGMNESTKDQLGKALETGEKYLIDRIIETLDIRISQALCWTCWRD